MMSECLPLLPGGTSSENDCPGRSPTDSHRFHRTSSESCSKSSTNTTRGSRSMPASPGYFAAIPSDGNGWGDLMAGDETVCALAVEARIVVAARIVTGMTIMVEFYLREDGRSTEQSTTLFLAGRRKAANSRHMKPLYC